MKLIIASLTAATVLASAASAMVQPTHIDNVAAAQNALGQVTNGVVSEIATSAYGLDGRSEVFVGDTVSVTSFKANERPLNSTDLR
ncbi:hypothetical protein [Planktotalea sp.]|uniref:hypothetical protein n=1 Tax=Planktotalea sp. TaxID=2029877 RepID=UPI003297AF9E